MPFILFLFNTDFGLIMIYFCVIRGNVIYGSKIQLKVSEDAISDEVG